ncbi:mechanosensitive ion channel family protein [Emergencia timonensis]|uniref:mechanosensitive ion channel family protein n=1 Tax=Emergencia timonensis TaxID=1776384 RepID=UPI00399122E3
MAADIVKFLKGIGIEKSTIDLLSNIGGAVITLILGWIAIKIILRIEKKALAKSRLDEALHLFILKGTKVVLWILVIIAILPNLGISTGSFVAVLGAAGAAIALALKDSLGNIAGGIIILINKPFSRGDTIEVAGTMGMVDSIDLLTTQLHTFDNKVVTIPNGTITMSVLINYSQEDTRRVDCVFSISYEADILKAKEILLNVISCNPDILGEPAPIVGVASHGDNAVILDLKVWCSTESFFDVKYYLEENVKLAFDEAGIGIPYPQMDIHLVK